MTSVIEQGLVATLAWRGKLRIGDSIDVARTGIVKQGWEIKKSCVELDANGCGEMIYGIQTEGHDFDFALFASNLSEGNERIG